MKKRALIILAIFFIWFGGLIGRAKLEESSFRKWAHSKTPFSTTEVMLALDRSHIELFTASLQFVPNPFRSDVTLYFFLKDPDARKSYYAWCISQKDSGKNWSMKYGEIAQLIFGNPLPPEIK